MSTEKGNQAYYDPGLVDKGWEDMRKILDKEMPQKKRRFLFWLPMLAGVVMIVAALLYFYSPKDVFPAEPDKSSIQPIPEGQIPAQQDPAIQATPSDEEVKWDRASLDDPGVEKQAGSGTILPGNTTSSPDLASAELSQNHVSSKLSNLDFQNAENKAVEEEGIVESEERPNDDLEATNEGVESNSVEGTLAMDDQEKTREEPSLGLSQQLVDPISIYQARSLFPIWIYPIEIDITELPADEKIEKERSKLQLAFGISAGLIGDHRLNDFSWSAGPEVSLKFNRILALNSGMHYWQIKSDRFFLSASLSNFTDEAKDFTLQDPSQMADIERTGGTNVSAGSADQRLAGQTDMLRYIRIPLTIQFFPEGILQPHIGISQLLLTRGATHQEFALSAVDQPNTNLQISAVSDFVRKRNLVYEIGLSFQPVENLIFDLTHGLENKSYLNYDVTGPGFSELHRYWRLSAGYRF